MFRLTAQHTDATGADPAWLLGAEDLRFWPPVQLGWIYRPTLDPAAHTRAIVGDKFEEGARVETVVMLPEDIVAMVGEAHQCARDALRVPGREERLAARSRLRFTRYRVGRALAEMRMAREDVDLIFRLVDMQETTEFGDLYCSGEAT